MERVPTGINGFDELIQGGIPKGSTVLYCGSPGTGKSIFGLEFCFRGASQFNEKSLFVSFEQRPEQLINQASQFGWNLKEHIDSGMLEILSISAKEINRETSKLIVQKTNDCGFKRVVIDSLSTLTINAPIYSDRSEESVKDVVNENIIFSPPVIGDALIKRFIYTFIDDLKQNKDTTTILIGEAPDKGEFISRDTISEFISDGVIIVTFESLGGEFSRSLLVRKMRNTKNDEDIHPLEVGQNGLVVHKT